MGKVTAIRAALAAGKGIRRIAPAVSAIPAWDRFGACYEFFELAPVRDVELSRFDVWLQAAAGSGSGQTAVSSNPTVIPTEISRSLLTIR
jgi:hypothetical protein